MTQPPRFATWMLKHFGSGPDNETLLGDLAEQYQRNGNAVWYWRQTLKAIPVSFFKDIRAHKWIAGRALLTGWVIWMAFVKFIPLSLSIAMSSIAERFLPNSPTTVFISGHRAVFSFVSSIYGPFLVGILCGWMVAHLHRNHRTAVVLLFAGSVIPQHLQLLWRIIFYLQPLAVTSGLRQYLYADFVAEVVASLFGILLGGGLLFGKSNNVAVED